MDDLERLIQQHLERKNRTEAARRDIYHPGAEDFYRYLNDEMGETELERMLGYLKGDEQAQAMVLKARQLMSEDRSTDQALPAGLIDRAKALMPASGKSAPCPHCGRAITPFKRPVGQQKWVNLFWLLLSLVAFALSFVFRRYFMQCLAVSVIAAVKWAVEMRATKTQILIYKALSEEPEGNSERLKGVKNRDGGI